MPANGVVGYLRALLTADGTAYASGLKKAQSATDQFSKSIGAAGKASKTATDQIAGLTKGFQGDRLLKTANNLVEAVTKIGGATKLTANEQIRLNNTLTKAIDKYKALGQAAPQAMLDLQKATKGGKAGVDGMSAGLAALTGAAGGIAVAFGTRALSALEDFTREAVSSAGEILDLRDATGLSTDTIQEMQFVAEQTSTSLEAMTKSAFKLGVTIAGGGTSVKSAVHDLGLSLEELQHMRPDEQWNTVVAALGRMTNEQERNRIGVLLMGKTFKEIAPAIAQGYVDIAKGASKSSQAQLEAIDKAADRWDGFWRNFKVGVRSYLGDLVMAKDANDRYFKALDEIATEFEKKHGTKHGFAFTEEEKNEALRRARMGLMGGVHAGPALPDQFKIGFNPKPVETYAQRLAQVRKELAALKPEQRAALNAELEAANLLDTTSDDLDKLAAKYHLTSEHLKVFAADQKNANNEVKNFREGLASLARDLTRGADKLDDVDFEKEFGEKLEAARRDMEKFGITGAQVPPAVAAGLARLNNIKLDHFYTELRNASAALGEAQRAALQKDMQEGLERRNKATLEDLTGTVAARKQAVEESDRLEDERANYAIDRAQSLGATRVQILAMESRAAADKYRRDRAREEEAYRAEAEMIDRSTTLGEMHYRALEAEHNLRVESMTEEWAHGEEMRRAELRHTQATWRQTIDALKAGAEQISRDVTDTFGSMLVGLTGFKEGFIGIWRSIRQAIANVLSGMFQDFLNMYLRRMIASMAAARLAGGAGGAVGTATTVASVARTAGLLGGGAAAAGAGAAVTGAGGMLAGAAVPTSVAMAATPAAIASQGASAGAAAGAGGGIGSTIGALASNPITWAVAGGLAMWWGIAKKGWFRGGETGILTNPRRDLFLSQFGPGGTGPTSGFGRLAAQLTQWSQKPGGGPLFAALIGAKKYKDLQAAEASIIAEYGKHGRKGIKAFNLGGFVPPGQTQMAILHGGARGEMVVPLARMSATGRDHPPVVVHQQFTIEGVVDRDNIRTFFRDVIIPETKRALFLNTSDITTSTRRAVVER